MVNSIINAEQTLIPTPNYADIIMEKKYLTVQEAAKFLGVTPLTLRNWDKNGKLKAYRNPINNYRLYKKAELQLFLRKIETPKKMIFG